MQRVMQHNCAVFRDAEILAEGVRLIDEAAAARKPYLRWRPPGQGGSA